MKKLYNNFFNKWPSTGHLDTHLANSLMTIMTNEVSILLT